MDIFRRAPWLALVVIFETVSVSTVEKRLKGMSGNITYPTYTSESDFEQNRITIWRLPHVRYGETHALLLRLTEMRMYTVHESDMFRSCSANLMVAGQNICGFKPGICFVFQNQHRLCDIKEEGCLYYIWMFNTEKYPRNIVLRDKEFSNVESRNFVLGYKYFTCEEKSLQENNGESNSKNAAIVMGVLFILVTAALIVLLARFCPKEENCKEEVEESIDVDDVNCRPLPEHPADPNYAIYAMADEPPVTADASHSTAAGIDNAYDHAAAAI